MSSGNKFKGSNFFSGINKPMTPEYIGTINYITEVDAGVITALGRF